MPGNIGISAILIITEVYTLGFPGPVVACRLLLITRRVYRLLTGAGLGVCITEVDVFSLSSPLSRPLLFLLDRSCGCYILPMSSSTSARMISLPEGQPETRIGEVPSQRQIAPCRAN